MTTHWGALGSDKESAWGDSTWQGQDMAGKQCLERRDELAWGVLACCGRGKEEDPGLEMGKRGIPV